jgi:putative transposase
VGLAVGRLEGMAVRYLHRQSSDGDCLAPQGLPSVLDLEDSARSPGRPRVPREVRELIRMMSRENAIWGAPRIHGELLKLGIEIGETSVSKYMIRRRRPPSQTWRTFLENHVKSMVSVDFFTVPTIRFQILYVFLVLAHDRRRILHFAVTAHPTAEWTVQQLREAFPWDTAPRYLLRDRDRIFGQDFSHQVKAMDSPPFVKPK